MFTVSWNCLQRYLRSVFCKKGLASWLMILDRSSALERPKIWRYTPDIVVVGCGSVSHGKII